MNGSCSYAGRGRARRRRFERSASATDSPPPPTRITPTARSARRARGCAMKSEWRLFGVLAAFVFAAAAVYAWWSRYDSAQHSGTGHVEWIGFVALVLTGLLLTMCGSSLWLISRRIEPC